MTTNLHIDQSLLAEAVKAGKHKTKREAVESALREYVQHYKRLKFLEFSENVEYWPGEDPASQRRRARQAVVPGKRP